MIGIEEKQGQFIPLDTTLIDENGQDILLRDAVDGKPFILSLVYYECPSICGPLLSSIANVVESISLRPGEDFIVVSVSFDPDEKFELARNKKQSFYKAFDRKVPQDSWRFFTASPESIKKLTEAVGFRYKKIDGQWVHSGAVMAISPLGKIARYLFGLTHLPFDVQMALVEASEGKTGPTITRFLKYCYSYDPQGRRYVFNILAVVGVVSLGSALVFFIFLIVTGKKRQKATKSLKD